MNDSTRKFWSIVVLFLILQALRENNIPQVEVMLFGKQVSKDDVSEKDLYITEQMNSIRKVSIANSMDSEATLLVAFNDGNEWDLHDKHTIKPHHRVYTPYYMPGVLSIQHDGNAISIDITDRTKEYIFTIESDGKIDLKVI